MESFFVLISVLLAVAKAVFDLPYSWNTVFIPVYFAIGLGIFKLIVNQFILSNFK